jgi:phosphotransferase system HPr (HPr) family protein
MTVTTRVTADRAGMSGEIARVCLFSYGHTGSKLVFRGKWHAMNGKGATPMVEQTVTIRNRSGLHARPASLLVQEASRFQSQVTLTKGDKTVDLKSILGVMSLAVMAGDTVVIRADGVDEREAVDRLVALINAGLGEEA